MDEENPRRLKKRMSVKQSPVKKSSASRLKQMSVRSHVKKEGSASRLKRMPVKRMPVELELRRNPRYTFGVNLFSDGTEIGHFDLDHEPYPPNTYSAKIGLEDDQQKKGYSTLMVKHVCQQAVGHMSPEQRIYIGADSSEGYWKYLGFVKNETANNKDYKTVPGAGYELMITFEDLCKKVGVTINLHESVNSE